MKVLVLNFSKFALKYHLIDVESDTTLHSGKVGKIGPGETAGDHQAALATALKELNKDGHLKDPTGLGAVAHRVIHGGSRYAAPVVVDQEVKDEIRKLVPLLPLHQPSMLAGIQAAEEILPGVAHVAVFDTTFHRTIPDEAAVYGLPHEMFQKRGIRKFGFHGDSHRYTAEAAAEFLETPLRRLNVITCHLGDGASVCAVQRGRSIDTSMGFSPLQGLIMGTRTGDLDPGIIPFLMKTEGLTLDQVDDLLHRRSGLLGLSGVSDDMLQVLASAEAGDGRALLAVKAYCYRVKTYVGAYSAAMGGVDVLTFTGGVGQNSRGIRARCVQGLERIGIAIDHRRNVRESGGRPERRSFPGECPCG
jgi:acetate kinase